MENSKINSRNDRGDDANDHTAANQKEEVRDSAERSIPREGMSAESARFLIGQCENYKIQGIENKGRYFQARVLDHKGKVVNELLVDKLNGNIKFTR
jgi:hypothetical protein